jgi:hypothetical protein
MRSTWIVKHGNQMRELEAPETCYLVHERSYSIE